MSTVQTPEVKSYVFSTDQLAELVESVSPEIASRQNSVDYLFSTLTVGIVGERAVNIIVHELTPGAALECAALIVKDERSDKYLDDGGKRAVLKSAAVEDIAHFEKAVNSREVSHEFGLRSQESLHESEKNYIESMRKKAETYRRFIPLVGLASAPSPVAQRR